MQPSNADPYASWYPYLADNNTSGSSPPPSVFGALPQGPSHLSQPFTTFSFIFANGDVRNSFVSGPQGRQYFTVTTSPTFPEFTVIKTGDGRDVGAIGWQKPAFLEIPGIVLRQTTKRWIGLSGNHRYRTMDVQGRRFFWVPQANTYLLYDSAGGSNPSSTARITEEVGCVDLEITSAGITAGLLEVCIVASVLFASGCNLD